MVSTALGHRPDYLGIALATTLTDTNDPVVISGIAIQSQYPLAIIGGDARGMAQVKKDQMEAYGLEGENPYLPSVAVKAMKYRIYSALDACTQCTSDTDNLLLAAIAQNDGLDLDTIKHMPTTTGKRNGPIDWDVVFNEWGDNTNDPYARARQNITGMNYNTKFMLQLFINDLEVLIDKGYTLPEEFDEADFKNIYKYLNP